MYHFENKETSDLQKLQDQLEKQYGPAVAQDIVDNLRKKGDTAKAPDYMDVKAMSELQERFRAQAMTAVLRLKEWRRDKNNDPFQKNLVQLEGAFLERQCRDAFKLYRHANKSYFRLYREAMAVFTVPATYSPLLAGKAA